MTLKVACVVPYPPGRSPGQRFRFEQWLELLPPKSVEARIYPLFDERAYARLYGTGGLFAKSKATLKGLTKRIKDTVSATRADVVFLYREAFPLGPPLLDTYLERRVPVVFDFDDAIYLGDTSAANSVVARMKMPQKIGKIVAASTVTTVGNEFLASFARQHSQAVRVVPTTIDVERYRPRSSRHDGDLVRVGWSGSKTTSPHLDTVRPALMRALKELPIQLYLIGDPDSRWPDTKRVVVKGWEATTEVQDISSFDIGLMPLPDDDWSRGKCGLKALQYMALEVPPIVSPVGVNTSIISHNENGLVARNEDEWVERIATLVESASLRTRLGKAARQTVVERFSGQEWSSRFLLILEEAAATSP